MAQNLSPPPRNTDPELAKWLYSLWQRVLQALTEVGTVLWSDVDTTGSNITDLTYRDHTNLTNLNSTTYYHLTATEYTWVMGLSDSGGTAHALTIDDSGSGAASGVTFDGTVAQTISYNTLGAPKADGTGASGTWDIAISGNAASATMSKNIPTSTTSGTLVAADTGKCVKLSAGITVPASIFTADNAVSLYNNTAGNLTITQGSGLTLRKAGTATTGNLTLAQHGLATIWFISPTEAVLQGAS